MNVFPWARVQALAIPLLLSFFFPVSAQQSDSLAHSFIESKQWDKAVPLLQKAYAATPGNNDLYQEYLGALLATKDYKTAEQLVGKQQQYNSSPGLLIDLGNIYAASGKAKKATEQYDAAVAAVNGEEIRSQQLANAFSAAGRDDYAIKVYERSRTILQNPYVFSSQLARLYAKKGDIANAVDALLTGSPSPYGGPDDTKSTLLELLGKDPGKLEIAQKAVIRRVNLQPENTYYADLLTWLYIQKGDWDGALLQVQAIDERTKSGGQALLQFAQLAEREEQHETAIKSLDAIIEAGKDHAYYAVARAQKLSIAQHKLEQNPLFTKEEVAALAKDYENFIGQYPQYAASDILRDYAMLEAQYNNNPKKGIELLQHAIEQPTASREFIGRAKLQLGDYQILDGKVWDASLTYSQVDKAFREDLLGEEARFKNGKLAYYRGDFAWAQTQLSVLKASTSELIANDALYLSVLITENTPDSNNAALLMFANADLLLFQNKDAQALKVLDSITTVYPKHPLQDDVLMLRSTLAQKAHDYPKALSYLEKIYKEYGKDVLGDDAVFKTAEIYEKALKKPEEARKFYEQLIIDYPGSTYVQSARERLHALSAPVPQT